LLSSSLSDGGQACSRARQTIGSIFRLRRRQLIVDVVVHDFD
jgi:hypothetical protein